MKLSLLEKFFQWARKDTVCAFAFLLALFGAAPHILESLGTFIHSAVIPLVQAATGGN